MISYDIVERRGIKQNEAVIRNFSLSSVNQKRTAYRSWWLHGPCNSSLGFWATLKAMVFEYRCMGVSSSHLDDACFLSIHINSVMRSTWLNILDLRATKSINRQRNRILTLQLRGQFICTPNIGYRLTASTWSVNCCITCRSSSSFYVYK